MASISLGIIDGTGPLRDKTYAKDMAHSFCKQLDDALGSDSYYQQGPWFDGSNDAFKMYRVVDWLKARAAKDPSTKLMLAGYSRGASTVMCAAEYIAASKLKIDSLFLFDAVARDLLAYGPTVSANVTYCRHAIRSQDAAFVSKYESYLVKSEWLGIAVTNPFVSNVTRPWFGGVGKTAAGGVDFRSRTFKGSHGALGGVGWKDVPEDAPAQADVASWMNPFLAERGVKVALQSYPPSSS